MRFPASAKSLALALLAGCAVSSRTIDISLAVAPGSHLLDDVQALRLVVTNPYSVATAIRQHGGFSIRVDIDLPPQPQAVPANSGHVEPGDATGEVSSLIVDGLNAEGTVIATGASPPFSIYAVGPYLAIYMGTPNAIAAAPSELGSARDQIGIAALPYGAVLAGGRGPAESASDEIAIYNAYDHTLSAGIAMPAPRSGVTVATRGGRYIFLIGGRDSNAQPTSSMWRLDTRVAPTGAITKVEDGAHVRADQIAVPMGDESFLITGAPPLELSGPDGRMVDRTDVAALPASAAAVSGSDGVDVAIFVDGNAVTRYRNSTFEAIDVPAAKREGATVVALPGGKVAIVCGDGEAVRLDPTTGISEIFPAIPRSPRAGCAVAATRRQVVIAGGTYISTGTVATTAEIYDANSLALLGTVPLVVPRTGAKATPLPNDQILIASGLDDQGAPSSILELFTPASLE